MMACKGQKPRWRAIRARSLALLRSRRRSPRPAAVAEVAAQPARDDRNGASRKDAAEVEGEQVAPSRGATTRYVVRSGDTMGGIAGDHCLALADLQRLNPEVRDPRALRVDQALAVEDRCLTATKGRAAAD